MENCKNTYKEYVKCMNKNKLKHHKNGYIKYMYCPTQYVNFTKCLNAFKDIKPKIKDSNCPHFR